MGQSRGGELSEREIRALGKDRKKTPKMPASGNARKTRALGEKVVEGDERRIGHPLQPQRIWLSQVLLKRERLPPHYSGVELGFVRPEAYTILEALLKKNNIKLLIQN